MREAVEKDVGGLDVSMRVAATVEIRDARGSLEADATEESDSELLLPRLRSFPSQKLRERASFQHFHHDCGAAKTTERRDTEESADARVTQRGQQMRFVLQSLHLLIRRRMQYLDGYTCSSPHCLMDRAHSALANQLAQLDFLTGNVWHRQLSWHWRIGSARFLIRTRPAPTTPEREGDGECADSDPKVHACGGPSSFFAWLSCPPLGGIDAKYTVVRA